MCALFTFDVMQSTSMIVHKINENCLKHDEIVFFRAEESESRL